MSGFTNLLRSFAVAACVAVSATPASAAPLTGVFVFGDSLVDSGNAASAARVFDIFPGVDDPTPASLGYFEGRFTNGYTFADHFGIAVTGEPPMPVFPYGYPGAKSGHGDKPAGAALNFAYGYAQAIHGAVKVPDFKRQVKAFERLPGNADSDALFIINFGGNDLFQVIDEGYSETRATAYLRNVARRIAGEIARLESLGAQHFLVTGAPDIGIVPAYAELDDPVEAEVRARATQASRLLDAMVQIELARLEANRRFTADLQFFSYFDFIDGVLSDPALYGLPPLNFSDMCLTFRSPDPSGHVDCTGFAFFDDVHPTAEVHFALYQAMQGLFPTDLTNARARITEIPEPAALALLGGGLIFLALARRRFAARRD